MKKFDYALQLRREQLREHKNRSLYQQRKRIKQQELKENLFLAIIGIIIISICFIILSNLNKKDINNCINAGYTKEYCERGF